VHACMDIILNGTSKIVHSIKRKKNLLCIIHQYIDTVNMIFFFFCNCMCVYINIYVCNIHVLK
jgi:hypothetical protein